MMNQETYVKVHDLRRQGWTIGEIAAETWFHPETISIYRKADGPPTRRRVPDKALVMNARWKERVAALIGTYPRLLGISRAPGLPESCHPCKPRSLTPSATTSARASLRDPIMRSLRTLANS